MLDVYGVKLNHTLHEMIKSFAILPGDDSLVGTDDIQQNIIQVHHQLEVEQEAVVLLRQSVTLKILIELLSSLQTFLEPILNKLEFFIYFHLHDCKIFNKYLKYQIATLSSSQCPLELSDIQLTVISDQNQQYAEPNEKIAQVMMRI